MKKIGTADNGNIILESTELEYKALCRLVSAVTGETLENVFQIAPYDRDLSSTNFVGVFGAIEAFCLVHYQVNELQNLVDRLRASIDKAQTLEQVE